MENATKALLIAAAILVAIIIISIGLAVVRQGQEAVGQADLSEAEMEAFNSKFKAFEGTNVSTADVNALISTTLSHNLANKDNQVEVYNESDSTTYYVKSGSTSIQRVSGSTRYTVTLVYDDGIVVSVKIKAN